MSWSGRNVSSSSSTRAIYAAHSCVSAPSSLCASPERDGHVPTCSARAIARRQRHSVRARCSESVNVTRASNRAVVSTRHSCPSAAPTRRWCADLSHPAGESLMQWLFSGERARRVSVEQRPQQNEHNHQGDEYVPVERHSELREKTRHCCRGRQACAYRWPGGGPAPVAAVRPPRADQQLFVGRHYCGFVGATGWRRCRQRVSRNAGASSPSGRRTFTDVTVYEGSLASTYESSSRFLLPCFSTDARRRYARSDGMLAARTASPRDAYRDETEKTNTDFGFVRRRARLAPATRLLVNTRGVALARSTSVAQLPRAQRSALRKRGNKPRRSRCSRRWCRQS